MKTARINFQNQSQFPGPVSLAFFDAPENYDRKTLLLPWHRILHCPLGHSHPFVYSFSLHAQLTDPAEKRTRPFLLKPGWLYSIRHERGYDKLELLEPVAHNEIVLRNDLWKGSRGILLSRSGNPAAFRPALVPGDYCSFRVSSTLVTRRIAGTGLTGALPKNENHIRLALEGIHAANLVLTGGGTGEQARACSFTLEKI